MPRGNAEGRGSDAYKMDPTSPTVVVRTLAISTKRIVCEIAERYNTSTSQVVSDLLYAVEEFAAELFVEGRRRRALIELMSAEEHEEVMVTNEDMVRRIVQKIRAEKQEKEDGTEDA